MSIKPDFTQDTLKIKLPNPFAVRVTVGEGDKVEKLVTHAQIRRMTAPELTRLKNAVSNTTDDRLSFLLVMKEMLELAVEEFFYHDKETLDSMSIELACMELPFESADKIMQFATMLTRESSMFSTAYQCEDCNAVNEFNLDPDSPVPKDVEKGRQFMQDYMDFYYEKVNKAGELSFTHELKRPHKVRMIVEKDDGDEESEIEIRKLDISYPKLKTYLKIAKDSKKSPVIDTWVIYEHIDRINDLTEEETKSVKELNGHDKLMKIHRLDWSEISKKAAEFGIEPKHKFQCSNCGSEQTPAFDRTNFFDFLKS